MCEVRNARASKCYNVLERLLKTKHTTYLEFGDMLKVIVKK